MVEAISRKPPFPSQCVAFDNTRFTTFVEAPKNNRYIEVNNLVETQEVLFPGWNVPINIDFENQPDSRISHQVADFLSTGRPCPEWRILKQRPHHNNPFSRNLEVLLPDGQMLVIGGVLVQDTDLVNRDCKKVICSLPNPNISLNNALGQLGLELQSYNTYDPVTRLITQAMSESPILGGYTTEGLSEKLSLQSTAESVLQGLDVIFPKTIMHGSYQDKDIGAFYAYLKPLIIDSEDMILVDEVFKKNGLESNVFPNAIYNLARLVRQMHDRGFIHFQLHSGNWGLSMANTRGEENEIYIGDFETCSHDNNLPLEPKIQDFAKVIDGVYRPFLKGKGEIFNDNDYFDQVNFALATGYQNVEFDDRKRLYMYEKMLKKKRFVPKTRKEMVAIGQEYLSWSLERIYSGFNFLEYLRQFRPK